MGLKGSFKKHASRALGFFNLAGAFYMAESGKELDNIFRQAAAFVAGAGNATLLVTADRFKYAVYTAFQATGAFYVASGLTSDRLAEAVGGAAIIATFSAKKAAKDGLAQMFAYGALGGVAVGSVEPAFRGGEVDFNTLAAFGCYTFSTVALKFIDSEDAESASEAEKVIEGSAPAGPENV